jgi:glutathione S-transferase
MHEAAGLMKLHWSPRSPFVRKVMIAAHEVGVADRLHCVRTVVAPDKPHLELLRDNPQSRLPTLVLADGAPLYDSPVICEYLDTLYDGTKLFPAAWPERLVALRRQALGDGMLDTLLLWLGERFRPTEQQSQALISAFRLKTRASLDLLEADVPALEATPFGIGHIALGVALSYLDFRFASENWRDGHPNLARWHATFNDRPAVRATLPVDEP